MSLVMHSLKSTAAAALVFAAATGAYAQSSEVIVKTTDGTLTISGELVAYDDETLTIRSTLGEFKIARASVDCEGDGCPVMEGYGISIVGSDTMGLSLMPLLLSGFADVKNGVAEFDEADAGLTKVKLTGDAGFGDEIGEFSVASTSTSRGFEDLQSRTNHIAMASRRIRPAEARSLRDVGAGNMISDGQEHIVAVDSLSVVVHAENPVEGVSLAQLDGIYSGRITNWSELGGPNQPIKVFALGEEDGTRSTFDQRIFSETNNRVASIVETVDSAEAMNDAVLRDRFGIGYVGAGFVRGTKALPIVGECGITSRPGLFASKAEEYPLDRRLYLYNRADNMTAEASEFVRFTTSNAADSVIAKAGFVDLSIARREQDAIDGRMRALIENTIDPFELSLMRDLLVDMFQWDRLSTTFRFAPGSTRLDAKGLADLDRLIDYLAEQPEGSEIALVGFTDGDGAFEANRTLSLVRAQQVADAIDSLASSELQGINVLTKGYGEMAPSACNETLDGKRINRRVEVWIRKST